MRFLLGALTAYLLAGAAFALSTMPPQTWVCPDASAPHGHVTYGDLDVPSRKDCRPTVSAADRTEWFAFATTAWLPLIAAKGLSNLTQP